jgi:Cysteine-rich secretory protein family
MAPTIPDLPTVETAVIAMTNAYRKQHKLQDVRPNTQLTLAARAYAAFLAKNNQFSHTADGRQAGDRIAAGGYQWCQVAENLALHIDSRGFESRDLAWKSVEGWINSPGHRANLEAPNVTEIGVGVALAPGADPKFISVQLFARPKSMQYEFQISNSTKETVSYTFGGKTHQIGPSYAITHTACNPSALTFDKAGSKAVSARYEAADGVVYTLKPDAGQGVKIGVTQRQTLKK